MNYPPSQPQHEDEEDEMIPSSWWPAFLGLRRRHPDQRSLNQRVAAAIAFGRSQTGVDESLDDISGERGAENFVADQAAAVVALDAVQVALRTLSRLRRDTPFADPTLVAVMQAFDALPADAEHIFTQHMRLLDLPYRAPIAQEKRGRGRPSRRSPVVRAVVRAAMHHLHLEDRPISGGWRYATGRARARMAKRSAGDELTSDRAAAFATRVVAGSGLQADQPEIKGHMTEYVEELRRDGRPPSEADYSKT